MPEFLANFSNQITEYWNKFSNRQKIQIIVISVLGLAALVVLTLVLSQPNYVLYADEIDATEMNTIVTVLNDANIAYKYEDNATSLYVEAGEFQNVKLLLVNAGVLTTSGFTYKDAFNTTLTTSTDDRKLMQQLATENEYAEIIELMSAVDEARVKVVLPDSDDILSQDRASSASVMLTLNSELSDEQIYGIASWLESLVDNLSINNIKIMESSTSKLLYNGGSDSGVFGSISSYLEIQNLYEDKYEREIESLLLSRSGFDDAVVDVNLKFDFDQVTTESETHSRPEDSPTSLATKVYLYESTGTSTEGGGTPGTDSNADSTTYLVDNGSGSDSSVSISDTDYAVDTTVTRRMKAEGEIIHANSSVTVMLNKFVYFYEDNLATYIEEQGLATDLTWAQFEILNNTIENIDVDQTYIDFVSNASLIDDVVILAVQVPRFMPKTAVDNQVADYIPVVIIVLMIALLGYAVYKGTEPVEITEVEPELSVEEMLTTTKVAQELEAIEFDDKSEARVQIERFVDENPEAVAQLLRNWLNEDWE